MTSLDPPPPPKRVRFGANRPSILDTPGSPLFNAALDIALDSQPMETIEDVSQTPAAPVQARPNWDVMSASTPHVDMLPPDSQFSQIPPAQDYAPTQIDPSFPVTLPDTQVDLTQTQPTEYSDHYHEFFPDSERDSFFLPSIPEGVPVHHLEDTDPLSVHSSTSQEGASLLYYDSQRRIPRPGPVRPVVVRKKRGPYNTRKKRALEWSQKTLASQKSTQYGRKMALRHQRTQLDTQSTQSIHTQSTDVDSTGPTQLDESQAFASAPTPNVLGNDGRYGEDIDNDPVSQFGDTQVDPVSQRPTPPAMQTFRELQRRSRAREPARLVGERNVQPPRRQTMLPGQLRRRRISQNRFVSDPHARLLQRRPVRPIRLDAPMPQFRQLPLRAVINNLHVVENLTLEQWRQMGLSEFNRHDVIVKIPGGVLTRYRLVTEFRRDFEQSDPFPVSTSNGSASSNVRGPH